MTRASLARFHRRASQTIIWMARLIRLSREYTLKLVLGVSSWNGLAVPDERPLIFEASYTPKPPTIDGQIDDAWAKAILLTVIVRDTLGGGSPRQVVLRI